MWDERFAALGFAEADYFLRAARDLGLRASISDTMHGRLWQPIERRVLQAEFLDLAASIGNERNEPERKFATKMYGHSYRQFVRKWQVPAQGCFHRCRPRSQLSAAELNSSRSTGNEPPTCESRFATPMAYARYCGVVAAPGLPFAPNPVWCTCCERDPEDRSRPLRCVAPLLPARHADTSKSSGAEPRGLTSNPAPGPDEHRPSPPPPPSPPPLPALRLSPALAASVFAPWLERWYLARSFRPTLPYLCLYPRFDPMCTGAALDAALTPCLLQAHNATRTPIALTARAPGPPPLPLTARASYVRSHVDVRRRRDHLQWNRRRGDRAEGDAACVHQATRSR